MGVLTLLHYSSHDAISFTFCEVYRTGLAVAL
jgi:hypothetical protein